MIESHLSQFIEQLQMLISQSRLYSCWHRGTGSTTLSADAQSDSSNQSEALTSRIRSKAFENLAKVRGLLGQLSQCWVVTVGSGSDLSNDCRVKR